MVNILRAPDATLRIGGDSFDAFDVMTWTEVYDGVATLDLEAPWDPARAEALQAFAPLSMIDMTLVVDGGMVYTGTALDPAITVDGDETSITHTSYSAGGKLQDVTMPPDSYPLEWVDSPLSKIGDDVCGTFDLEFDAGPGLESAKFKRVNIETDAHPWDFLSELAKQKDALVATTRTGGVAIFKPFPKTPPVARLIEGQSMLSAISPEFKARAYYSDVTCTAGKKLGRVGGKATATNSLFKGPRRPFVKKADKSDRGDLKSASSSALGRMFGTAAGWRAKVPTWYMDNGEVWENGRFVTVLAPSAYIKRETDLLIRGISFVLSNSGWWAELELVLSDSFTDVIPPEVPWV